MDHLQQQQSLPISETTEIIIQKYLNSLSPKEYKAYEIAKSHLGTSFDMEKSIGYIKYKTSIHAS